ncbi:hypothetical protein [Lacticaseibacillus sp. GG6-2]
MRALRWVLCLIVIVVIAGLGHTAVVHAATPSVIPPVDNDIVPGFNAPSATAGVNSFFKTQPTWTKPDGTAPTPGWTIVHAGDSVQLRAVFNKGFWDWTTTATLGISAQKGNGAVQTLYGDWTSNLNGVNIANQYGLTYQTDYKDLLHLIVDNDDIRYGVVAPDVTTPTWFTFQLRVTLTWSGNYRVIYAKLARLLVLPRAYAPQLTASPQVLFPGQSATVGVPNLVASIVPNYMLNSTQFLQSSIVGNQLRVTSNNAVGTTTIQSMMQFAPMFNGEAPVVSQPPPLQVYSGALADQQVYEGQQATFQLQLPPGVSAENVRWYVAGKLQSLSNTGTLTLADAETSADVYAIADYRSGGQVIATNVQSNTAKLTVLPPRTDYQLTFDRPFLFAAVGATSSLGRTDQLQANVVNLPAQTTVSWRVTLPDSDQATDIASVTSGGVVSATTVTGNVDVVAEFTINGVLQRAAKQLTIIQLAGVQVQAGSGVSLSAPIVANLWPPGTQVSYSWYVAGSGTAIPGTPTAVSPAATYSLASVSSAQNNSAYQLVMRATINGQTQTVVSNVAEIEVTPPLGLALQVVPNFNFAGANYQSPTVGQMITGAGVLTNATGVRQLIVSNGDAGSPWQLAVSMSDFVSIRSLKPLSTTPDYAALRLQLSGASSIAVPPVQAGGDSVIVSADNTTSVAVWNVVGTLDLKPVTAPEVGGYGAQLHWTLTSGPAATAP